MNKPVLRPFDAAEFLRDEGDMTSYQIGRAHV